ncbi:hypothetical protein SAMN05421688_2316 [Poseidonocella pacifica]|uniref:Uncharacterized protein n=1 Tax=Poseidonocella pacifica TaxID=871651 RepID=A0A1I0XL84_9RHOB|nr:hypothetical protein SAMN05421688_2316 [Poseidonocella pacifica]
MMGIFANTFRTATRTDQPLRTEPRPEQTEAHRIWVRRVLSVSVWRTGPRTGA